MRGRRAWAAVLLAFPLTVVLGSAVVRSLGLGGVVEESYPVVERVQVGLWVLVGLVGSWACLRQRRWRGVLLLVWFGVLAMLAGLRELDLQVLLNPENAHLVGLSAESAIRWQPKWWLDGATPVGVRVGWGVALVLVGAMVVLPFALAGYPWPRRLRRLDRFAWLVVGGFGLLGLGFVLDDVGGEVLAAWGVEVALLEESIELGGELLLLAAVVLLGLGRVASASAGGVWADGGVGSAAG